MTFKMTLTLTCDVLISCFTATYIWCWITLIFDTSETFTDVYSFIPLPLLMDTVSMVILLSLPQMIKKSHCQSAIKVDA